MFGKSKEVEVYEPFMTIFEGKNILVGRVADSDDRIYDYQKIDELISNGYELLSVYGAYYPKAILKKPINTSQKEST